VRGPPESSPGLPSRAGAVGEEELNPILCSGLDEMQVGMGSAVGWLVMEAQIMFFFVHFISKITHHGEICTNWEIARYLPLERVSILQTPVHPFPAQVNTLELPLPRL
jgi:hypothetical protein